MRSLLKVNQLSSSGIILSKTRCLPRAVPPPGTQFWQRGPHHPARWKEAKGDKKTCPKDCPRPEGDIATLCSHPAFLPEALLALDRPVLSPCPISTRRTLAPWGSVPGDGPGLRPRAQRGLGSSKTSVCCGSCGDSGGALWPAGLGWGDLGAPLLWPGHVTCLRPSFLIPKFGMMIILITPRRQW